MECGQCRLEFRPEIIGVEAVFGGDFAEHPLARSFLDNGLRVFPNRTGLAARRVGERLGLLHDPVVNQLVDHSQNRSQPDGAVNIALVHFGMFGGIDRSILLAQLVVGKETEFFPNRACLRLFGAQINFEELAERPLFGRIFCLDGNLRLGSGSGGVGKTFIVNLPVVGVFGKKFFVVPIVTFFEFLIVNLVVNFRVGLVPRLGSRPGPLGRLFGVDERRHLGVGHSAVFRSGIGYDLGARGKIGISHIRKVFDSAVDLLPQNVIVRLLIGRR